MKVTNVQVVLADRDDRVLAYCTVEFDNCFVVRNVKIIQGKAGLLVAMPTYEVKDKCQACRGKNPLRNPYCGRCGVKLPPEEKRLEIMDAWRGQQSRRVGQEKHFQDSAHPVNHEFRAYLDSEVFHAYDRACSQEEVAT